MGRRALKKHVQQELPKTRARDKNGQFRGGKRPGAGRPRIPRPDGRTSEPHGRRARIRASEPVHVVLRATGAVGSLRQRDMFRAICEASLVAAAGREDSCRIVHLSIQRSHIHLLIEASDRKALASGVRAFAISAAKHINAIASARSGERRRGAVFTDRYHAVILGSPRQVRHCVAYVLNNWRHHGEDRQRSWKLDPYATGLAFDGWKERAEVGGAYRVPDGYVGPSVWAPRTWLLRIGWRKHGLISIHEVPGRGAE